VASAAAEFGALVAFARRSLAPWRPWAEIAGFTTWKTKALSNRCDRFAAPGRQSVPATLSPRKCRDLCRHAVIPNTKERGRRVKLHIVFAGAVVAALACPLAAQAQGIPGGIAHGAQEGGQAAGPVGAVVGGAVGGVVGGVQGLLGIAPTYAAYPVEGRPVYHHHRHWRRHTYRHVRHHPVS
jgi:hypothetical protein